jgi:hypothetical protein
MREGTVYRTRLEGTHTAWIESHQSLGRHPKLFRLAGKLRVHKAQAIGHLQYLWWWALDFAPNGNLSAFTPAEISAGAEWPGEPGLFHVAMCESGWIDGDGMIHDWWEYAGRLIAAKEKDRLRKQFHRTSDGHPPEVHSTQPNPTNPTNTGGVPPAEEIPQLLQTPEFLAAWEAWRQHRSEIRKRLTPLAVKRQMNDLVEMGAPRAIAAIHHSIAAGYQGIFEPKGRAGNNGNHQPRSAVAVREDN